MPTLIHSAEEHVPATPNEVCKLQIVGAFEEQDSWFGFYGYTDWRKAFDWRRHN